MMTNFFIAVNRSCINLGSAVRVSDLIHQLGRTNGITIVKVVGDITADCMEDIRSIKRFYHGILFKLTKEHGVKFCKASYVDMLEPGMLAKCKNGRVYRITEVEHGDYTYRIQGYPADAVVASWTEDGHFVKKGIQSPFDLEEVLYD